MRAYFLGVDTGGSKSHAMLADSSGRVLALTTGGCGNPDEIGYNGLAILLKDLVGEAAAQAGISLEQIAGAGFGIAGLDWASQIPSADQAVKASGILAPCALVNDMILGLYAGAEQGWGVVVGAGTSCNCRGRDAAGREGRMVGYGLRFGEGAGAVELISHAIRAIALAWTCRGEQTSLTPTFVGLVGASGVEAFLEGIALDRIQIPPSAVLSILAEARRGDAVAGQLVCWAGQELASQVIGVARQLAFGDQPFDVVTIGSLFQASDLILEPFWLAIRAVYPRARLQPFTGYPVVGAVLLAMQTAGYDFRPVRDVLVEDSRQCHAAIVQPE